MNIAFATVSADKNPKHNANLGKNDEYDADPGDATKDKIFLLSFAEAEKYFSSESSRQCQPTAYAASQGAEESYKDKTCEWLLRSPGKGLSLESGHILYNIGYITYDGGSDYAGTSVNDESTAIRPALWFSEEARPVISTEVLDEALSSCKYYNSPFSISLPKLVNSAMDGYEIEYMSGEEAISQGYITESQIGSSVDMNYLYYAIISGDTMVNPDIPYMTNYEEKAVEVWMLFDENNELQNYGVTLCEGLETFALLIMVS